LFLSNTKYKIEIVKNNTGPDKLKESIKESNVGCNHH